MKLILEENDVPEELIKDLKSEYNVEKIFKDNINNRESAMKTANDEFVPETFKKRLEEFRDMLNNDEQLSYGELVELQGLAEYIDEGDVQLLEAAGVPEFKEGSKKMAGSYYESELAVVGSNSGYPISVQFRSDNGNTKWMNINSESIPVLIKFLEYQKIKTQVDEGTYIGETSNKLSWATDVLRKANSKTANLFQSFSIGDEIKYLGRKYKIIDAMEGRGLDPETFEIEDLETGETKVILDSILIRKANSKTAVKQVPVSVYEFSELSKEAKEKAIKDWYELEDYPFLSEDLTELLKIKLQENGIEEIDGLKLYYSLSYSQGDGAMFIGRFKYKDIEVKISSNSNHYSHSKTANFQYFDENGEDIDENETTKEFESLYHNICKEIEKEGYEIIDYRMTDEEFAEHCESNGYNFYENGKMANL